MVAEATRQREDVVGSAPQRGPAHRLAPVRVLQATDLALRLERAPQILMQGLQPLVQFGGPLVAALTFAPFFCQI